MQSNCNQGKFLAWIWH